MKKIFCFSYTKDGAEVCRRISDASPSTEDGVFYDCYAMERYCAPAKGQLKSLEGMGTDFYREAFNSADALIFVGAVGIAIRKIAPFITGKDVDPAVIVVDDQARFVIPVLSGHIGGANRLAEMLAVALDAVPVITTATDTRKKFAVDAWAVENELAIADVDMIKKISSAVLDGDSIGFLCDFQQIYWKTKTFADAELIPQTFHRGISDSGGIMFSSSSINKPPEPLKPGVDFERGICISLDGQKRPYKYTLRLIPKCIVAGMGCRKNIPFAAAEALLLDTLKEFEISPLALSAIATIDLKAAEPALNELSQKYGVPLVTYGAAELARLEGGFTASRFVSEITGVDNVCERASVICSGNGEILCGKRSANGVTVALAQKSFAVRW